MALSSHALQMIELDNEIQKKNEEIRKVWNELLLLKCGQNAEGINLPGPETVPVWSETLITNFINRSFIHKIFGYPEFQAVLKKSLISFRLKNNLRKASEQIGQIISVDEVPDSYAFCHDGVTFNTNLKLAVRIADRSLHSISLYEVSNVLPNPVDFEKYKSDCKDNSVSLPEENEAKEKEQAIKNAATRILTDAETYNVRIVLCKVEMIRFKGCKTEQSHAKEKAVTRRLRDIAQNRGVKQEKLAYDSKLRKLNEKTKYKALFSRSELKERIDKSIIHRLTDERINLAKEGISREPKTLDGFTRIPTFATKAQRDEMTERTERKFNEMNQTTVLEKSHPTDLFELHNFTTKTDIKLTSDIESQQFASQIVEDNNSEHGPKRKSSVSVNIQPKRVHLDLHDPAIQPRTSATTTQEKKKISFDEYKLRKL